MSPTPDGRRVLVAVPLETDRVLTLVTDWTEKPRWADGCAQPIILSMNCANAGAASLEWWIRRVILPLAPRPPISEVDKPGPTGHDSGQPVAEQDTVPERGGHER